MDRLLIISCDSHAGLPTQKYREYLDPGFREAFDKSLAGSDRHAKSLKTLGAAETYEKWEESMRGAWESAERARILDEDGVAAEILLSDALHDFAPPFGAGLSFPQQGVSPEQQWAGARAHNRWLADFCREKPERFFGVALLPLLFGIDEAVKEVHTAEKCDLRGVAIPSMVLVGEHYHHKKYDPFWKACQDTNMVVCMHAGAVPVRDYYGANYHSPDEGFVGGRGIHISEIMYWAYRPLIFLIWGGVFERFKDLRVVVSEVGDLRQLKCHLDSMDMPYQFAGGNMKNYSAHLSMRPSDYFRRNVYVSGFSFNMHDADARESVGTSRVLWGSDYPHPEGTWPRTREILKATFSGIAQTDIAAVLGVNAIECFGLGDRRKELEALAARIGPESQEFLVEAKFH